MKTQIISSLFALTFLSTSAWADTAGLVGRWTTIDDETNKPKSVVEITQSGKEFKGKVVELLSPEEPNPKCTKCDGAKKDAPIQGLEIMWGLHAAGDEKFEGGSILDPNNGKVYRCHLKLIDGGQKLDVRGYIGISLFGRTQTWIRNVDAETATPAAKEEAPQS